MAHHKRRKPKNSRAGCLLCHPWKVNGCKASAKFKGSDKRRMIEWNKEHPFIVE